MRRPDKHTLYLTQTRSLASSVHVGLQLATRGGDLFQQWGVRGRQRFVEYLVKSYSEKRRSEMTFCMCN